MKKSIRQQINELRATGNNLQTDNNRLRALNESLEDKIKDMKNTIEQLEKQELQIFVDTHLNYLQNTQNNDIESFIAEFAPPIDTDDDGKFIF